MTDRNWIDFDVQLFPVSVRMRINAPTILEAATWARDKIRVACNWAHIKRLTPLGFNGGDHYWIGDKPTRVEFRSGLRASVHFVGFRDPQKISNVARITGYPDFFHMYWDDRAQQDMLPGDVIVFADTDAQRYVPWSYDDSNQPNDPAYWERLGKPMPKRRKKTYLPA